MRRNDGIHGGTLSKAIDVACLYMQACIQTLDLDRIACFAGFDHFTGYPFAPMLTLGGSSCTLACAWPSNAFHRCYGVLSAVGSSNQNFSDRKEQEGEQDTPTMKAQNQVIQTFILHQQLVMLMLQVSSPVFTPPLERQSACCPACSPPQC
jgi:hypothetical protein